MTVQKPQNFGHFSPGFYIIFAELILENNKRITEQINQLLTPQPDLEVLPKGEDNTFVVVSGIGAKQSSTGTVSILGEIYNVAGYELSEVEIVAALYNDQNRVVDRGSETLLDFMRDDKYVFEIKIFDAAPFSRYEVTTHVTE